MKDFKRFLLMVFCWGLVAFFVAATPKNEEESGIKLKIHRDYNGCEWVILMNGWKAVDIEHSRMCTNRHKCSY